MNQPMTAIRTLQNFILSIFFLSVLMMPVAGAFAQSNDPDKLKQFEDAILRGEDFLKTKEYAKAKAEYQKALIIDPSAKYPKEKLTYIRKFYIDPEDEARFAKAMENGNQLLANKDFSGAREQYGIAVNIKPEDKIARENLAKADNLAIAKLESNKQYEKLITNADKLFAAKDMTGARAAYDAASKVSPDENYPRQRISEIDVKAEAEKSQKDAYEKALTEGDDAYMNRDFVSAKLKYELALKIKPGENYPKSMLERVAEGTVNLKDAQQNYQLTIANADKLFNAKDYETALLAYQNAAKILPGEKYPAQQIEKINAVIQQRLTLDENYTKTISAGNQFFDAKQYAEARTEFQKANDLKPGEAYPKQKIEDIAVLLLALKEAERNKVYATVIASADQLFDAKDYTSALAKYQEAASIKAEETYPKDRIAAIDKLKTDELATKSAYEKTIATADQKFAEAAFAEAIAQYQSAQNLNPNELYPAQQIAKAQQELAKIKIQEDTYKQAVADADKAMGSGDLDAALKSYQQALTIKPGSVYPQEQITTINASLAVSRSKEEQYQKLITDADQLYQAGSLKEAVNSYKLALEIKSQEKYPIDQVKKINGLIEEQNAKQASFDQLVADADKLYSGADYDKALVKYKEALIVLPLEKYPQEKILSINSILEQRISLEENYTKNINEGDIAFKAGNPEVALGSYEKASALKPAEKYPLDKISEIRKSMAEQTSLNDNYKRIIAEADRIFSSGELAAAALKYKEAGDLKPAESYPQQQIGIINSRLTEQKNIEETYRLLIVDADRLLNAADIDQALSKYREAQTLKPSEVYPGEQIAIINTRKGEIAGAEQAYNEAITRADNLFNSGVWDEATSAYNQAQILKPSEQYPRDRIASIVAKKSEQKTLNESYQSAIVEADRLFDAKEYLSALQFYQKALALKPAEEHPQTRISTINSQMQEQLQLASKDYNEAIEEANRFFTLQDYISAMKAYETASALKPEEDYPKNKLIEINTILMERARNQADAYNKIIMKADLAYQDKVYDQAIDAYEEAKLAKPGELYPDEMIRKIRKYMEDHAMVDLVSAPLLITADTEQKFRFTPIEMRLRKNNYIIIKARKTGEIEPKVYLNYGIDGQKSGGIVLRSIKSDVTGDYLIRVSVQDRWYRLDNNWISVYSEGGDVEISRMQVAQGD